MKHLFMLQLISAGWVGIESVADNYSKQKTVYSLCVEYRCEIHILCLSSSVFILLALTNTTHLVLSLVLALPQMHIMQTPSDSHHT